MIVQSFEDHTICFNGYHMKADDTDGEEQHSLCGYGSTFEHTT